MFSPQSLDSFLVRYNETRRSLTEASGKSVELFIGRFQPLHNGHATVLGRMKNPVVALVKGKDSGSDKNRNPLSAKDQGRLIRKVIPGTIIIEVATGYIPDIAESLRKKGMELTAVWAGEDRKSGYERQFASYNKKNPDNKFNVKLKQTFDPTGRIGGTSATLVREAIREDDKETFLKHMPKKLHSEWEFLRKKIK
jgi:FAD synthase